MNEIQEFFPITLPIYQLIKQHLHENKSSLSLSLSLYLSLPFIPDRLGRVHLAMSGDPSVSGCAAAGAGLQTTHVG